MECIKDVHLSTISIYCSDCKDLLCLKCLKNHNKHMIVEIDDYIENCLKNSDNIIEEVLKFHSSQEALKVKHIQSFHEDVEENYHKQVNEIESTFRNLHDKLYFREVELKREIKSFYDDNKEINIKALSKIDYDTDQSKIVLDRISQLNNNSNNNRQIKFETLEEKINFIKVFNNSSNLELLEKIKKEELKENLNTPNSNFQPPLYSQCNFDINEKNFSEQFEDMLLSLHLEVKEENLDDHSLDSSDSSLDSSDSSDDERPVNINNNNQVFIFTKEYFDTINKVKNNYRYINIFSKIFTPYFQVLDVETLLVKNLRLQIGQKLPIPETNGFSMIEANNCIYLFTNKLIWKYTKLDFTWTKIEVPFIIKGQGLVYDQNRFIYIISGALNIHRFDIQLNICKLNIGKLLKPINSPICLYSGENIYIISGKDSTSKHIERFNVVSSLSLVLCDFNIAYQTTPIISSCIDPLNHLIYILNNQGKFFQYNLLHGTLTKLKSLDLPNFPTITKHSNLLLDNSNRIHIIISDGKTKHHLYTYKSKSWKPSLIEIPQNPFFDDDYTTCSTSQQ